MDAQGGLALQMRRVGWPCTVGGGATARAFRATSAGRLSTGASADVLEAAARRPAAPRGRESQPGCKLAAAHVDVLSCWRAPPAEGCAHREIVACHAGPDVCAVLWYADKMFQTLWMWREEYQHHEQLPLAFNGTWPSWNSDLDNRPW